MKFFAEDVTRETEESMKTIPANQTPVIDADEYEELQNQHHQALPPTDPNLERLKFKPYGTEEANDNESYEEEY